MIEYFMLIAGLFLIIKGADILVEGGASLAHKFRVSYLLIGLTVLAFGTSLPELIINIISAIKGSGEIVFGSIIGSNMSNILLVLGIISLIFTIKAKDSTIKKEIPYAVISVLILIIFASYHFFASSGTGSFYLIEGIILLMGFTFFLRYVIFMVKTDRKKTIDVNVVIKDISNKKIVFMVLGGLIALYLGGKWTVEGAVLVAQNLGLSEFFISATIMSIGTSLPELVLCVVAVLKKQIDMVLGNIVGSNIFNILWVIGVSSLIAPIPLPSRILIDLIILVSISFLLLFFVWKYKKLNKYHGASFLAIYVLYLGYLFFMG
ncbi:MAG: calcium/sodium antiporter [Candidatus Nanoarchaeia archaeon]